MRRRLLGLLGAAALALSCDRGALQPDPGTPGAAGAGAIGSIGGSGGGPGSGGAAGSVVAPGCDRISTAPGVFNPCGRTYAIAFSAESGTIAIGTEAPRPNVRVWRLWDGSHLRDIEGIGETVHGVSFPPTGGYVVAAGGNWQGGGSLHEEPQIVKAWTIATGAAAGTIPAHCGMYATTAEFSPDGGMLLTAGFNGPVEVWRVSDDALLTTIPYPTTVHNAHFSWTGREVIVAGIDRRASIWSVPDGSLTRTFDGISDEMADAVFSPDGREVASTGPNQTIEIWDAITGALRQSLAGHTASVSHVLWAGPDRVVSNDWSGTVKSWTRAGGSDFAESASWTTGGQSLGLALSPDGKLLAAGGADPTTGVEGFVFLAL